MAAITYSGSSGVFWRRHRRRPNPMEKRSTLIPRRRATQKWPNSCTLTRTPIATVKASNLNRKPSMQAQTPSRASRSASARASVSTCINPASESASPLSTASSVPSVMRGIIGKADPVIQEVLHRHLVRGIQHRRRDIAGLDRLEGETQTGEPPGIRGLEIQMRHLEQVERRHTGGLPLWPGHGMGYGRAHIRVAHLGQHRAVLVFDHGMNHALRVHHDLNQRGPGIEQPAGLDHLQPLVHHGGGIHRDLAPHVPIGMAQACSGVTFSSDAGSQVRKGPPEAVSRIRVTRPR